MAQEEDGQPYPDQPYPERSQTPDLQGAGMPAVSSPSVGLLAALGNTGAVSPEALTSLMGGAGGAGGAIPNAAILGMMGQPPSQLGTYAAALSGGISAMRGKPDPVQEIQQNAQKQQNAIALMMQKMQTDQRLERQWGIAQDRLQQGEDRRFQSDLARQARDKERDQQSRSKFLLDLNEKAIGRATDPAIRDSLAQERGKLMKNLTGVDAPPSEVAAWAMPPEDTADRRAALAQAFVAAEDPTTGAPDPTRVQMIAKKFGLTPEDVTYWSGQVKSDAFLAANHIPDRALLKDRQTQYQIREQELIDSTLPFEKRKAPEWYAKMEAAASRVFPTKDFQSMDPKERAQVFDWARRQDIIDSVEKHQQISAIDAQRQIQVGGALMNMREGAKGGKTLAQSSNIYTNRKGEPADPAWTEDEAQAKGYFQIKPAELVEVNSAGMALKQLEMWKAQIDKMKKAGLTAESSGLLPYLGEQVKIGTAKYRGPEQRALLNTFESMKTELINLLRKSGDNARAAYLLAPTINAMSPYAGAKGLNEIMSKLEQALRAGGAHTRTPELYSDIPTIFPLDSSIPGVDQDGWGPGRAK